MGRRVSRADQVATEIKNNNQYFILLNIFDSFMIKIDPDKVLISARGGRPKTHV